MCEQIGRNVERGFLLSSNNRSHKPHSFMMSKLYKDFDAEQFYEMAHFFLSRLTPSIIITVDNNKSKSRRYIQNMKGDGRQSVYLEIFYATLSTCIKEFSEPYLFIH